MSENFHLTEDTSYESWIPAGACSRAAERADPGAGMTGGSTEKSISREPGVSGASLPHGRTVN